MVRTSGTGIRVVVLALAGAAALSAGAQQESTRYRMIEGSLLVRFDPDGSVTRTPVHGTFDLVPSMVADELLVQRLRGFDQAGNERVSGHGVFWTNIGGQQRMLLDVFIEQQWHGLDSGLVWPTAQLPMVEIDLAEIVHSPDEPWYALHLIGVPALPIWFSTEIPFTPASGPARVSDGDVCTTFGQVLWTNPELTADLGIQPPVPDIGLDALHPAELGLDGPPWWEAWFSAEIDVFSTTLGPLHHGDFLSEGGFIVARNEDLTWNFMPMPIADFGLDAITWGWWCEGWYFSTEEDFWSDHMQHWVGHGDLLCARDGWIVFTNAELLANFNPVGPVPPDCGLDAVYMWPSGHIWFSLDERFEDADYGWISDGDLLSMEGWVIYRNRDLVRRFNPLEPVADFGLDAAHVVPVQRGDMNGDTRINAFDIDPFVIALTDRERYYELYPELDPDVVGDVNYDGRLDAFDIDPFVRLLTGG